MIVDIILFIMWFSYLSWIWGMIIHDLWELDKEIKELEDKENNE